MKPVHSERGFSLIELLMAMTITLIITGAIFGLVTSGQNAFRREPAMTDRQQNIRAALDMIQRDLTTAGMGMDSYIQAFRPGLNNVPVVAGGTPSIINNTERTDFIELAGNDGTCPAVTVLRTAGVNLGILEPLPSCFRLPGLVYVSGTDGSSDDGFPAGVHTAEPAGGGLACGSSHVNFPPPRPGNPPGGFCGGGGGGPNPGPCDPPNGMCGSMSVMQLVRYEIAPDPADGMPSLWRSETGRASGGAVNVAPPGGNWQLVARGVEDLQVQYTMADGRVVDAPDVVVANTPATLVRQVQVTLAARAEQTGMQGETPGAGGAGQRAYRGQVGSITTPRAVLATLSGLPDADPLKWR